MNLLCRSIPISYLETYLNFQPHFNIKELITKHVEMLNKRYLDVVNCILFNLSC